MKKSMTVFIALALLALGGAAWAADSNTLTVQASVAPTCRFSSATSLLDFGALDPFTGPNVNISTTTNFWCTSGVVTDAIAAGNGANWSGTSRQMAGPGGHLIPYSLGLLASAGPNLGPSAPRTLTISGGILGADYMTKNAGNYSDTVTLTITP
ncbi:MAG TPA: spore coat protein U domain-containing protein [Candidatus Methylomirabilis sp.]|nr:spore coat protein U domain-containing protein [Candidatus Methylomirabilis sp.]